MNTSGRGATKVLTSAVSTRTNIDQFASMTQHVAPINCPSPRVSWIMYVHAVAVPGSG